MAIIRIAAGEHKFDIARELDLPRAIAMVGDPAHAQFQIVARIDADRHPAFNLVVDASNLDRARRLDEFISSGKIWVG